MREDLLALLVCPIGKTPLRREAESLVCTRCGLRFAIVDGIPNMLVDEATLPDGCTKIADLRCSKDVEAAGRAGDNLTRS